MESEFYDISCTSCCENIDVNSKHASFQGLSWHSDCFVCCNCRDKLENVLFVLNESNELLCHKCFDEMHGTICIACQEIIKLGQEKFKLGDLVWHRKCFQCQQCHNILHPNSFWLHENLCYCKNCYGELFTEICGQCHEKIWKNGLKFRDINFHTECFVCNECKLPISDKRFLCKNDLTFCEKCHNEKYCKTCARCNELITGLDGNEMITSNNENWHNKCFFCNKCEGSLIGLSFVEKEKKIFCPGCFK